LADEKAFGIQNISGSLSYVNGGVADAEYAFAESAKIFDANDIGTHYSSGLPQFEADAASPSNSTYKNYQTLLTILAHEK